MNRPACLICGQARPRWSAQKSTSGGSSDTEAKDWQAKPTGSPSAYPVTTVTPVAKEPIALRISRGVGGSSCTVSLMSRTVRRVLGAAVGAVPLSGRGVPGQRDDSRGDPGRRSYGDLVNDLSHDDTLRELSTDNGVLRYHEAGPTDAPPLLMLHGSGPGVTGWRNFRGNLALFAEHFRCLVLEFPGFGVSDPTDQHPMAAALPAVERFLDGLGLDQVDVIGNSMGGIVGTRLAIAQPDRVRRLVTDRRHGPQHLQPGPGRGHQPADGVHRGPHAASGWSSGCTRWCSTGPWSPRS